MKCNHGISRERFSSFSFGCLFRISFTQTGKLVLLEGLGHQLWSSIEIFVILKLITRLTDTSVADCLPRIRKRRFYQLKCLAYMLQY